MGKRKAIGLGFLAVSVIVTTIARIFPVGSSPSEADVTFVNTDPQTAGRIESALPRSIQILDTAMATLEKGWEGMGPDERTLFLHYFDPGNTGEVDEAFVRDVLENFRKVRGGFDRELKVIYESESKVCYGMRLFYTDFSNIHICPYIHEETNPDRVARDLLHEMVHISLLVFDRAYYSSSDPRYRALTPRGHWSAELPVIGRIVREIVRADTLYHPDAYARFALAVTTAS